MQPILEALVLHDYEAVFLVDIKKRSYRHIQLRQNASLNVPAEGSFDEANKVLAHARLVPDDSDDFLKETMLDRILAILNRDGKHTVKYRIYDKQGRVLYRSLSFIYTEDRQGLIGAVTDETQDMLDHIEQTRELWLKNECIRFIVRHMCENFIIVNPETDEATTFVHDRKRMQPKPTYREQVEWFADNIVVPEEREEYLKYFNIHSIIQTIRDSGGISTRPCTVNYPDGRHDFIITNTLITDPELDEEKFYLFTSAQDVSLLKRANETGEKLLVKSQQDSMTGLYNRDTTEKLIREFLYSGREDGWNTFILIDIDHFKSFNDTHGHILGDAVLRFMGDAMREVFRASDVLCRWGGDEFVIFIPNFRDEYALKNRLVSLQTRMGTFKNSQGPMPLTLSIGGIIARNNTTLNALFAEADEALYTVKERGRNGIELKRGEPVQETAEVS